MDFSELETKLDILLSSKTIVDTIKGPLWVTYPTLDDKQIAHFLYEKAYKNAKSNGVLTLVDTSKEHKKNNVWSDKKDQQLEVLPKFIKDTENELEVTKGPPSKIKKLNDWLKSLHKMYAEVLTAKNAMIINTCEFIANEESLSYLIFKCFKSIDNVPLWPKFELLKSSTDIEFIAELMNIYTNFINGYNEILLRKIARHGSWRVRWNTSKNDLATLFGRTAGDLSNDQFMLIYWSQVYDMVYESMERPPDEIIEDNVKLDAWLEEQTNKRKAQTKSEFYSKSSIKSGKNKEIQNGEIYKVIEGEYDKNGIFIPYSQEQADKMAKNIEDANTPNIKKMKQQELEKLKSNKGQFVDIGNLRSTKTSREAMGATVKTTIKG